MHARVALLPAAIAILGLTACPEPPTPEPPAEDTEVVAGPMDPADSIRGLLRPYEGDLPGREQLEALSADPVADLQTLLDDPDPIVRANAAFALGSWSELEAVRLFLLARARDTTLPNIERAAAIGGLERQAMLVGQEVLPLLAGTEPMEVQVAAARLLVEVEELRPTVEAFADDETGHPAARRLAAEYLTRSSGPDQVPLDR